MRTQKNIFKMKEYDQNSGKELNKTKISDLPNKGFKVLVIKILTELRRRIDEY